MPTYNIDTKLNILWLSDVHYTSSYGSDESKDLAIFKESFLSYIGSMNSESIDYILLSGDIAQSGEKKDYDIFIKEILNPLQTKFERAKLLVIPGNHDVLRNNATFTKKFTANLSNTVGERLSFFGEDIPAFEKIFEPYTSAFIGNSKLPKTMSDSYKSKLLYGYALDVPRKIIFVLLNSAWYSVGQNLLQEYLGDYVFKSTILNGSKEYEYEIISTTEEIINKTGDRRKKIVKDISSIADEYGNQLLGLNKLDEIDNIIKLINKYNDYIVISIMHHPINWLNYDERVTTSDDKFHTIRHHTDVLLTGHEHVSKIHLPEFINPMLHIQAGCFMDAPKKNESFKINREDLAYKRHNWFSSLEINIKKRTLRQEKHFFDIHDNRWKKCSENEVFAKLSKKYKSTLPSERRDEIVSNCLSLNLIKKAISRRYPKVIIEEINENFLRLNDKLYIFICANDIVVNESELKKYIDYYAFEIINFVFLDVFNDAHVLYLNKNDFFREPKSKKEAGLKMFGLKRPIPEGEQQIDRLQVLQKIKNDFDFKFDLYRYKFFKKLSQNEVQKYQDLRFVSIIKPYWELEAYFNS